MGGPSAKLENASKRTAPAAQVINRKRAMVSTTVEHLIENPASFDGQTVETVGFYVNEREHHAIYPSKDTEEHKTGIWLVTESVAAGGESQSKLLNRRNIRIIGSFSNRRGSGTGHFNLWPAELRNITLIEAASAQ
jgi:hypothetical protein